MPYLIDTDWLIDHLNAVPNAVQLLNELSGDGIAIRVVTYMEVYQGITRSSDHENVVGQFETFLEGIPVLPFSLAVARQCARLREYLKRQNRRVNPRALEHDLTLVTCNINDYNDIPNLKLYQAS